MNLLFDQNISFRIIKKIDDIFPGSKQVSNLNLQNSTDLVIWEFAKKNNYCIVTFDSDFIDLSMIKGSPPKIIWLRIGNTSTDNIAEKLHAESKNIRDFLVNNEISFLEIE